MAAVNEISMIQAIVYDAVGTLIHIQPAVGAIYADVGRRFGTRPVAARGLSRTESRVDPRPELVIPFPTSPGRPADGTPAL